MLLAEGANINARNRLEYGETALMGAARFGDPATIQLLLDNGADLKARTKTGDTVLMFAIPQGYVDNVKLLLDNGADVNAANKYGQTALITVNSEIIGAENKDRLAITKLLISRGAKVNFKDKDGETALDYALDFAEDKEMGWLLYNAGARRVHQ
jgi:ankyrin repeat protein